MPLYLIDAAEKASQRILCCYFKSVQHKIIEGMRSTFLWLTDWQVLLATLLTEMKKRGPSFSALKYLSAAVSSQSLVYCLYTMTATFATSACSWRTWKILITYMSFSNVTTMLNCLFGRDDASNATHSAAIKHAKMKGHVKLELGKIKK